MTKIAAVEIEYEVEPTGSRPASTRRIHAGESIPDGFPEDSLRELSKHGSIVSSEEWAEIRAENERRRQPVTLTVGALEDIAADPKRLREIVRGEYGGVEDGRG